MNNNIFDLTIFGAGSVVNGTESYVNATDPAQSVPYNGGGLSPEMKTFYDRALIELAKPNLVHTQFGQKRPVPKNGGKTVEFRRMTPLAKNLNAITEGVTPSGSKMTVVPFTATMSQYGDYIEQTDLLEMTSIDNTVLEATKLLADQAGRTVDSVVRDVLHTGTNVNYASRKYGNNYVAINSRSELNSACKLRVVDVFKAAAQLKALNAPTIGGKYVAIIHPHVAFDLMQESGDAWVDIKKYADPENILAGELGTLGGVRFVESSEAKINYGDDVLPGSHNASVTSYRRTPTDGTATYGVGTKYEIKVDGTPEESLVGRRLYYFTPVVDEVMYFRVAGVNPSTNTIFSETEIPIAAAEEEDLVCPGEGGQLGEATYSTLFLGEGAYGLIDVNGEGAIEHIVKQRGYGNDPLDQRSSVGWKAFMCAAILCDDYILRVESGSSFGPFVNKAN